MSPIEIAYIPKGERKLEYTLAGSCLSFGVDTDNYHVDYKNELNGGEVTIKNNETKEIVEMQLRAGSSYKTKEFIITAT